MINLFPGLAKLAEKNAYMYGTLLGEKIVRTAIMKSVKLYQINQESMRTTS